MASSNKSFFPKVHPYLVPLEIGNSCLSNLYYQILQLLVLKSLICAKTLNKMQH